MSTIEAVLAGGACWCMLRGDCVEVLRFVPEVDVAIFDPPYSRRVHDGARTSRRRDLPDVAEFACRQQRRLELGFDHLSPHVRRTVAAWCAQSSTQKTAAPPDEPEHERRR